MRTWYISISLETHFVSSKMMEGGAHKIGEFILPWRVSIPEMSYYHLLPQNHIFLAAVWSLTNLRILYQEYPKDFTAYISHYVKVTETWTMRRVCYALKPKVWVSELLNGLSSMSVHTHMHTHAHIHIHPPTHTYIVSCRPIGKQQLCKQATVQQPLLGNSSVDTFPRQRENTQ
jgi:hypothetical protein